MVGYTYSSTFPKSVDAHDATLGGTVDAFLLTLSADGSSLDYSTYLGGAGVDRAYGVALDTGGNIYVAGDTDSGDFDTTAGAYDQSYNGGTDAFVVKFSTSAPISLNSSRFAGLSQFESKSYRL